MDTSKATPRPWKRGRLPDLIVSDQIPADGMESSRADPEVFAYHGGFFLGESFSEADREFTLRAVNAHEQAVSLLKIVVNRFPASDTGYVRLSPHWIEQARALIANLDAEE